MGEVPAGDLSAYVRFVGQQVLAKSHQPDETYTFRTLDSPDVNAFALPGGYIYMTRGILAYLNSEASMAGVLGHEIGHVTARHSADRYTKTAFLGLGATIGGALLGETGGQLLGAAAQLSLLKYGRDDERQADKLGVEYATAAGHDTHETAELFRTLSILRGDGGGVPEWASTHPDPADRFETVKKLTDAEQAGKAGPFQINRNRFLRAIDGMTFGKNPREGFVDAGLFKHPELDFQFAIPAGWQLQNSKLKVALAPPDQKSGMTFSMPGASTAASAADGLKNEEGITELERTTVTIAGFPAVRTKNRVTVPNQPTALVALATFIERDGRVYAFMGLSREVDFPSQESNLLAISNSFAPLADTAAKSAQPMRIKIVTAGQQATLKELVAPFPLPKAAADKNIDLAVLNGINADTTLAKGTLFKVIVQ